MDKCEQCGAELGRHDVGDGAAVFLLFLLCFSIVPLAWAFELAVSPPLWVHAVLWGAVSLGLIDLVIFGKDAPRVGNTTLFALEGASSETQLIALDLAGICVSNGSACSSGTVKSSHALKAMGVAETVASSSLRVSLGWNTTEAEVDYFIEKWIEMQSRVKGRLKHA